MARHCKFHLNGGNKSRYHLRFTCGFQTVQKRDSFLSRLTCLSRRFTGLSKNRDLVYSRLIHLFKHRELCCLTGSKPLSKHLHSRQQVIPSTTVERETVSGPGVKQHRSFRRGVETPSPVGVRPTGPIVSHNVYPSNCGNPTTSNKVYSIPIVTPQGTIVRLNLHLPFRIYLSLYSRTLDMYETLVFRRRGRESGGLDVERRKSQS